MKLLIQLLMIFTFWGSMSSSIQEQGMSLDWNYKNGRIHFKMDAPTRGWVAIGFNETSELKGTYLLMGRVINGEPEVVEHKTLRPGNYKSFVKLGQNASIGHVQGYEDHERTFLNFSLPVSPNNSLAKSLKKEKEYSLLMAYSVSDDFQHHSIMRTSIQVKL